MRTFPSSHSLKHGEEQLRQQGEGRSNSREGGYGRDLVWLVQRILQPGLGMTRPRCIRSLQLVGPV